MSYVHVLYDCRSTTPHAAEGWGLKGTSVCVVMFRRVHTVLGIAVVVTRTCNPVDTLRKGPVQVQGYQPRPWLLYIERLRTECFVHSKICTQLSSLPPTPRKRISPSSIEKGKQTKLFRFTSTRPPRAVASNWRHTRIQKLDHSNPLMRLPVLNLLFLAPVIGNSK
jgi:hypothetical protein